MAGQGAGINDLQHLVDVDISNCKYKLVNGWTDSMSTFLGLLFLVSMTVVRVAVVSCSRWARWRHIFKN